MIQRNLHSQMFIYMVVGPIETVSYTKCTKSAVVPRKTLKISE